MGAHTADRLAVLLLWKFSLIEECEMEFFLRVIGSNDTVLDIGANVGFYTLLVASQVGIKGSVYAFEPDRHNFATLVYNIHLNSFDAIVKPVRAAVSDTSKKGRLWLSDTHSGDHRIGTGTYHPKSEEIDCVSIDDRLPGMKIDAAKIDVQGAEPSVLRGMRETIRNNPQIIILLEFAPVFLRESGVDPLQFAEDILAGGLGVHCLVPGTSQVMKVSDSALRELAQSTGVHSLVLTRQNLISCQAEDPTGA